jgi:hypothetical protein
MAMKWGPGRVKRVTFITLGDGGVARREALPAASVLAAASALRRR